MIKKWLDLVIPVCERNFEQGWKLCGKARCRWCLHLWFLHCSRLMSFPC